MKGRAAAALLRTAAREAIAERDMNAAGALIADLAPHDNEGALRLLEECGLTYASDRGGMITMVLIGLLGSGEVEPASIAAWVDRLPPSEGPLQRHEPYLLAFEHPLLEALAERTAERCAQQLEADMESVFAVNEDQRPPIREIEQRVARVAVPLAALAAAHSLGPAKDRILRAAARVAREMQRPAIRHTARKVMLRTFIESWRPVRQPEFVDFYLGMLGEPSRNDLFPSSLDGMEDFLAMGWALFDARPERARALADSAFSFARERLVDDSPLDDMGRTANALVEALASGTGSRPHEVTAALEFGEAAERWALKCGFAEVAPVLDELAGLARKDGVRTVLAGAATKMRLKAGDLQRAGSWLQTAPFETLDALDIVSAIPTAPEHRSWSRRMLADRLGQFLRGAALDADWLGKLITVGIESLSAEQASARLRAIEDAWSQEEAARTA
jgi:hypothetical protein